MFHNVLNLLKPIENPIGIKIQWNSIILGSDDMGISGDFLPRTLSRWHEHGFDPKHVQADDWRVVDHPIQSYSIHFNPTTLW